MPGQDLQVKTELRMARPPRDVFEAIVDPHRMSGYFTSSGSGRLDGGKPVSWRWEDVGAELTVTPVEVEAGKRVVFLWSASGLEARVELRLEADDAGGTLVKLTEGSWPPDAEGTERCLQQMQGWVHMLCCMKAYLEYGINLREGGVWAS